MLRAKITEKKHNYAKPLQKRAATNLIVIHHTGNSNGADTDASAEQIHGWHLNNNWAGIGYHFVIRKNGTIERGRPVDTVGSHAYGRNSDSVGIHLSGTFTRNNYPTELQIEMCAMLVANLCTDYKIPIDRKHVIGHREVAGDTDCPGDNLFNMLDTIVGKANWYANQNPDVTDKPADKPAPGKLSEHFAAIEFACHHCGKGGEKMNPRLIELLEKLRSNIGGKPLTINSGYRCPVHNANVGGVKNSQHVLANAADVAVPAGMSFNDFKYYVDQLPFDGIGLYPGSYFMHVDVRNGGIGSKIYWNG